MIILRDTFKSRNEEIDLFLALMTFLEKQENDRLPEGISSFARFFDQSSVAKLEFQPIANIMKSNVALMIYNLLEFTVSSLVQLIYEAIENNKLDFTAINDCLQNLWLKTSLKAMQYPNAKFNTFIKKNEEMIKFVLAKETINLQVRHSLSAGNLDGPIIQTILNEHGIALEDQNLKNAVFGILESIKKQRNALAHGSLSFVEALRSHTISDLRKDKEDVVFFLNYLIEIVEEYLAGNKYRASY